MWWQVTSLWSHWHSLFRTSVDSAHGFQSQGGSIIAWILLLLACNYPQSQLWIPRPGPGPNFTPWYGEATARVTAHITSRNSLTFGKLLNASFGQKIMKLPQLYAIHVLCKFEYFTKNMHLQTIIISSVPINMVV